MVPDGPAIATTPLPAPPARFGPEVTVGDLFITLSNITTVVDSGSVTEINLSTTDTMVVTGTITTSFECTNTRAPGPTHKYFFTAAAGRASGFQVTTNGAPSPITTFTNPTITEVHFSGKVIAPNVAFFN
jgi:hypothetical protein